jgi:hypothetical protein
MAKVATKYMCYVVRKTESFQRGIGLDLIQEILHVEGPVNVDMEGNKRS